ncbi:GbsR/MarR family transcriptional regulator [Pseudonocardia nigra]|uniref:GbsR/MarR family transcriptional regulator n=1 Tax=Pseudonocardia nigra TaxID=1921578 RepID=UPI0027E27C87|nr:MarR family transcriptional regulator [Pseudonocardia nigra]
MREHGPVDEVAERLALALTEAGMQRMVARVLAAFLFSEQESVTAGELGDQLGASAGSISAAITVLRTVAMIEATPVPGSRRAHYRLRADAWATLMTKQNAMFTLLDDIGEAGLAVTDPDGPAAVRLRQMRSFYAYLQAELPALIERWQREQDAGRSS